MPSPDRPKEPPFRPTAPKDKTAPEHPVFRSRNQSPARGTFPWQAGREAERRTACLLRTAVDRCPSFRRLPRRGKQELRVAGGETDGRQDGDSARSALCPSLASRFSRPFPAASPTFSPALARPAVLAPPCRPFPARKREPYAALAAEGRHVPHCGNGTASPRSRNVIPALRRGWKACSASRGRVPRRAWRC